MSWLVCRVSPDPLPKTSQNFPKSLTWSLHPRACFARYHPAARFATGASTVRVRARSPHASELLPGKSKSRLSRHSPNGDGGSNENCEVRAEGEQKPSGAVERASHDDARPTEPTAYTLKGINALSYFNSRAGEEKGGLEGKTPVLPSGVPRYCIPPAACSL